jgi:hypothetical protein
MPATPGESVRKAKFANYRREASTRGYAFSLTYEQFQALTGQNCSYCGLPPKPIKWKQKRGPCLFNGIDRVVNSKGYEPGNTVTCCWLCNLFKGGLSCCEFLKWTKAVYAKNISLCGTNLHQAQSAEAGRKRQARETAVPVSLLVQR